MAEKKRKRKKKKKLSGLAIAVLIIVAVMLMLVAAALTLFLSGRSALTGKQDEITAPLLLDEDTQPEEPENTKPDGSGDVLDAYTIERNGKLYRPKKNMVTLLGLGIDEDSPEEISGKEHLVEARADMIMLAAVDTDTGRMSFITLSRDTVCSFDMYDTNGDYAGQGVGQIALSFRYGDGKLKSCEITRDAVSELFGGIRINAVGAYYLDGVGVLNDAVGGVTVRIADDDDYRYKYSAMRAGETVTLNGEMAKYFLRVRRHTETGNLERMSHQRLYFKALLKQMIAAGRENIGNVLTIYNSVTDYLVTDLSLNELTYLASQVLKHEPTVEFFNVPGDVSLNDDGFAEYRVDRAGLNEILLDVYYEEVSAA